MSDFVGYSSDSIRRKNTRRAMIVRRHRAYLAMGPQPKAKRKAWSDKGRTNAAIGQINRMNRERSERGLEPIDHTVDHAGNPDHELDMLPDSLLRDS